MQQEIARIIEKEKVLTNMQEHLAHIQELEAERAAKHQEKRDKAKQKVVICAEIKSSPAAPSWPARHRGGSFPSDEVGGGLFFEFEPKTWPRCRDRETRWLGQSR